MTALSLAQIVRYYLSPLPTNCEGFEALFQRMESVSDNFTNVKAELQATGHYSYNLLGFTHTFYHNEKLKSLTHYRFDKVKCCFVTRS